jgi:DNA-binding transcriptional MerR regulator
MSRKISIGEAAKRTGVKVPTIRYYEQVGLLCIPTRSESNRRFYGDADLRRLMFIRHARDLGFAVDALRQLLDLADQPERSCAEADVIARAHLMEIDSKISRLTALRSEVQRMLDECAHGRVGECRVIRVLADHGQCEHARH